MEDDYIQRQLMGRQGGSAGGRGAIGPLPSSHPTPLSRLILRDLKLLITLSPEEEEQTSQPGQNRSLSHLLCQKLFSAQCLTKLCKSLQLLHSCNGIWKMQSQR